jgi:hypothetical protein
MKEYFVEYLMNTLDAVTRARVEAYLRTHPKARSELQLLEQALEPLSEDLEVEVPEGLALRTLARIAEYRCALPAAPSPSPHQIGTPSRRLIRHIDWLVACILVLLVGGLALPFIRSLWHEQQRLACSNNLRKFWESLAAYADRSEGNFPQIEAEGPRGIAGAFVPMLRDAGLLRDVSIDCAARGHQPPLSVTTADLDRLYRDSHDEYQQIAQALGGQYAYSLGYAERGRLYGLRRDSGDELPLMADCSETLAGNSRNHGVAGQNVLHVGGQVRWFVAPNVGVDGDNIYVNQQLKVHSGLSRLDSVLGSSHARAGQLP